MESKRQHKHKIRVSDGNYFSKQRGKALKIMYLKHKIRKATMRKSTA